MSQSYSYPSSSQVTISGIGTPNGGPIPASSVLIAGEAPDGTQKVVQTDANGDLLVSPLTSTSTVTVVQPTGTNLHTVVDSGFVAITSSTLPAGASTSSLQTSGNSSLTTIATNTSTIATNTTGAATAANQTTGNTSLASIDTKTPTVGQKTSAASRPVVIASDQSAVPVSGTVAVSNFPGTQPVSGSVTVTQATGTNLHTVVDSGTLVVTQATGTNLHTVVDSSALPTGAATSANQSTEITALGTLNTTLTNGTTKVQAFTPTALTITQAAVTVGTTAVRMTPAGAAPSATRVSLVVTPDASATGKFYIGSSSVTATGATRGIQIVAGQVFIANNDAGDYYIISDTAAQTVEIMSQG